MLVLASASPRRRELLAQAGFSFEVHPAHIPEDPLPSEDPTAYVLRLAREKAEAVFRELTQAREGSALHDDPMEEAEKQVGVSGEIGEEHPSGAKARTDFAALTARLKSCPDTSGGSDKSFSAACLAPEGTHSGISPASKYPPVIQTLDNLAVLGADTTVTLDNHILGKPEDPADAARMLRLLSGRTHRVITGVALVTASRTEVAAESTAVQFLTLSDEEIAAYISTGEPMDKAGAYAIQGRAARWIPRIEGDYFNVVGLPIALVSALLESLAPSAAPAKSPIR